MPMVSFFRTQIQNNGWPFLATWAHRISGVLLVAYVWFHIITLYGLNDSAQFDAKMKIFGSGLFVFIEWLLALPVIYHTLNGGRLLLYEIFGNRRDEIVFKWVVILNIIYLVLLAFFMMIGNQTVSEHLFWGYTLIASGYVAYIVIGRLRSSRVSLAWKLQRISAAFLLLMIPAHMLFMHINPGVGHDAQVIISRMESWFIKLVDILLVTSVLYHGAYGLYTISQDYIESSKTKASILILLCVMTALFAWKGLKLIVLI